MQEGKNNSNYKHGKCLVEIYCLDCNKKLSKNAFLLDYKRCQSCAAKNNWKTNPLYKIISGKYNRTSESKNKFRITVKINGGRLGNKNPNWIDGRSLERYPSSFNKLLKEKIKKRDNNICKNCSLSRLEHMLKYKRDLTIHHIDYNKQNCKENNLITTCVKCNIQANSNRDYWFAFYTYILNNRKN